MTHPAAGVLCAVVSAIAGLFAFAADASAQDQINVRFSWKLKGEYAPLYMAQELGLFKAENLDVRLGEGAGSQAALAALTQAREDIVVLPGIFALTAIQKGLGVKLISLYHPKTPVVLLTFPDKPARAPKDLRGMTVAHSVGETGTSYLDAFLRLNGVDPSEVKRVMMNAQARVPAFIARQVDVVSVYQTNDLPIMLETQKTEFVVLDMVEHGLGVPGLSLVTSDQNIEKKADALKRFLRAAAAGIIESKKDMSGATRALRKNWQNAPSESAVLAQVKATLDAIEVPAGRQVGWINEKTIAEALALLKSAGEIEVPNPAATFYTNALSSK
jgi:NitT/TauT family transport system substrate-binding protein